MIELNEQQRQELSKERPARAYDPETNETYVLVKAADYERLGHLLEDEGSGLTMPQVAILVERAMREEDEGDPTLAFYQQKYGPE